MIDRESMYYVLKAEVERLQHERDDMKRWAEWFPVFKYQPKAPKRERPVIEREDGTKIQHPTVKPLELLRWLITLVTPEGGTVLEPFAGSGTTVEAAILDGFTVIGIERDADYLELIQARIDRVANAVQVEVDSQPGLFGDE